MIEDAILKYLGIYPESIERADGICERVCAEHGIDSDSQLWPYVLREFEDEHGSQLGNEIIDLAFRNLKAALVESGKFADDELGYEANGMASGFYIMERAATEAA